VLKRQQIEKDNRKLILLSKDAHGKLEILDRENKRLNTEVSSLKIVQSKSQADARTQLQRKRLADNEIQLLKEIS